MNRSMTQPLSLGDYEISAVRGFLPFQDPVVKFPQNSVLAHLAHDLPKYLAARRFRRFVQTELLQMSPEEEQWEEEDYRYAGRVFSFAAHAFVWEDPQNPASRLPANLAIPLYQVFKRLGRPPVLSYASYALDNWRRLDPTQPIELDNLVLLQNFLGGLDEEWFVAVHVDIEAKAGPALERILRAQEAALDGAADEVTTHLVVVGSALEAMCCTLDRMPERCDPYIYFHRVRPYIHGWKDNPTLPQGLWYEGVKEYKGRPQQFRGETGAQSSIIPSLDAALGIEHSEDPLTRYLKEMRIYMPPAHRAFIEALEQKRDDGGRPVLAGYVRDRHSHEPAVWKAYRSCVQLLMRFRARHLEYAGNYIHRQHEDAASNPRAVGTGGTPFMRYLRKHLEETQRILEV